MAINPLLIKEGIKILLNEEKRNNIILLIVTMIAIFIFLILVPIYLLTNPIENIKLIMGFDSKDIGFIEQVKADYPNILGKGELIFKGKFPLPFNRNNYV